MKHLRVNILRKQKGITAEQMARELFVTIRTYRKYESGDIALPVDILIRIADILDVSLDYLLCRDEYISRHEQ